MSKETVRGAAWSSPADDARWAAEWHGSGTGMLRAIGGPTLVLVGIVAACVVLVDAVGLRSGWGVLLVLVAFVASALVVVGLVLWAEAARQTRLLRAIRRRHPEVVLLAARVDRQRLRSVLGIDGATPRVGIAVTLDPDGLALWRDADRPVVVAPWADVELARRVEIQSIESARRRWSTFQLAFRVGGTVRHLAVDLLYGLPLARSVPVAGLEAFAARCDVLAGRVLDGTPLGAASPEPTDAPVPADLPAWGAWTSSGTMGR